MHKVKVIVETLDEMEKRLITRGIDLEIELRKTADGLASIRFIKAITFHSVE